MLIYTWFDYFVIILTLTSFFKWGFIFVEEESFEKSLKKLENIVSMLEEGKEPIEKSLELYKSGMELLKHCLDKLNLAEQKLIDISGTVSFEKVKKKEQELAF